MAPPKGWHPTEETRELLSSLKRGKKFSKEHCANLSKALLGREVWNKGKKDPESTLAKKRIAQQKEKNPMYGKRLSEETKLRLSEMRKGKKKSYETRRKMSLASMGVPKKDITIERIIETKVGGFWYGAVRYVRRLQYCEKWKDVNPRVHAFFNYHCVLCGQPEIEKSHIGHHVFYERGACCMVSEDGLFYTNLNAKDHPIKDYFIGDNPNYFVILCKECHGLTNGNYSNRKKWADYFRQIIDNYYGGKCYLSHEEFALLNPITTCNSI